MSDIHGRSHLFTLRLWPELRPGGELTWRARVTHVLSGETRHFRDWPALIGFLAEAAGLGPLSRPADASDPTRPGTDAPDSGSPAA